MKICDYGCNKEAKYQFKNGKWCCSSHYKICPAEKERCKKRTTGRKNPFYNKKHSEKSKKKITEKLTGRVLSSETRNKISKKLKGKKQDGKVIEKLALLRRLTIKKIRKRYPFFSQIEEMRYNPDKPGEKEIQVHCKNHLCPNSKEKGGWFTPTKIQFYERIRQLENEDGNGGSYFYCSEKCKEICPLYKLTFDPFKESQSPYTEAERQLWRQIVLEREEYICEYCGKEAICAHHEKPVKTHPHLALDPDNGISCCEKCHYKYGHKIATECSTGSLANKLC